MIPIENGIKVMKLIIAIIRDEASEVALESLINYEFRATRIASTGGFLRRGLTTLMIGVEDEKVEHALNIIKEKCAPLSLTNQRTATVFVLDVGQFLQI
ncbi:MAG: cyclic-di-AMP receptor [Anaerolineales bacterium]